MSLLSKLRGLKKTGDPPTTVRPESQTPPQPYHHIPTHACSDALSQAPPGAMAQHDKRTIREQRRLRVEMSRQNSSLSNAASLSRNSGTSDGWGATTTDQRKILPVFTNIIVAPPSMRPQTDNRDSPLALCFDNSLSTNSCSSSGGSSFLEIPPRNPRRHKRLPSQSINPQIPQIPEHPNFVEKIGNNFRDPTEHPQTRRRKPNGCLPRYPPLINSDPTQLPPVPPIPENIVALQVRGTRPNKTQQSDSTKNPAATFPAAEILKLRPHAQAQYHASQEQILDQLKTDRGGPIQDTSQDFGLRFNGSEKKVAEADAGGWPLADVASQPAGEIPDTN